MSETKSAVMELNKMCELEDWDIPEIVELMRELMPDLVSANASYPKGAEHRKVWEYAHVLRALAVLDAITPESFVLSIGSGHEEPLYYLSNFARWVFATDIYGEGQFQDRVAPTNMLVNPDRFARCKYNRNRIVVQHMSALDLRFEANTFDVVYSFSTIEHIGRTEQSVRILSEVHRVLKPGGIAAITTECVINGAAQLECQGLMLYHPDTLRWLTSEIPGLELISPFRFDVSSATRAAVMPLEVVLKAWQNGQSIFPQVVEEYEGRQFTSIAMFLRKTA